jgi:hypothetical protein
MLKAVVLLLALLCISLASERAGLALALFDAKPRVSEPIGLEWDSVPISRDTREPFWNSIFS